MKIIVPMAGMGKRMRPHTLTKPKPLIEIAGKSIVQRLVEDISAMIDQKVTDIGFVIGDFGNEVEQMLLQIAGSLGAKGHIFYQDEPLGTAHAISCAAELLNGHVIVAFADTLFYADFKVDPDSDGIIWVQKVEDPKAFGVVTLDENQIILDFVEKPQEFISDLAIIGIYYVKDGESLKNELKYLMDNNIKEKGEFQLTNALENMKQKGVRFSAGQVKEWLDCGNKDATVYTNQRILELHPEDATVSENAVVKNSVVIHPSRVGRNVTIENSVIGPHVSIGENTRIKNSIIQNSIILNGVTMENQLMQNAMIGNEARLSGKMKDLSIGDFTVIKDE
jgi:glucose-1-phosphate thymidylyltransferase